jgi:dTDP-4-amino-4,6-dideoxygalactose transaminase
MKIDFFKHNIGTKEKRDLCQVLDSIFLTTGDAVREFEKKLSKYIDRKYTIGLMSCTSALHLSMLAYGIGPGDEVITTPMTFVATATSIMHAGAKPVFVDVEPETGNLDADLIERALYGNMCDMRKIKGIAKKHNLVVIEDAAHAIEAQRDGYKAGELADAVCFSFYATKSITCGEGGAVSLNNKGKSDLIRKLSLHGITREAADRYAGKYRNWEMNMLGWKCNMSNIQASLLLNQLSNIEKYRAKREKIARRYEEAFSDARGIRFPRVPKNSKSGRHLFTIWVDPKERDEALHYLQRKGIGAAVNYRAIHTLDYFKKTLGYHTGDFPVAEKIGDSTISLPLYPKLSAKETDYIIKSVRQMMLRHTRFGITP